MATETVALGPFKGGMHNSAGSGDFIKDDELFELVNLEVDTDGSLVNRPAINELTYTVTGDKTGVRVLGTYLPADGRRFLVIMTAGSLKLIDLSTNTAAITSNTGLTNASVVQYNNRLWVIPGPTDTVGNGGYFEALPSTAPTWTTTASIPRGGFVLLYKERLWTGAGIDSTTNTSRIQFSALGDGTSWPGANFIDVEPGNGEKLVYGLGLNNDIIFFKQHSTFRFTYDIDPAKAVLSKVSSNIGVPAVNCAVTYDNNNIYIMHDNSVYEFFNFTFTRISEKVDLSQKVDLSLYASDTYGLSLYRDRLFVRYYSHLYVYSLNTGTWSRWETTRKFSKLVVIPTVDIGLDIAYCASATSDQSGKIFSFRNSRTLDIVQEQFECSIRTKTYDFDISHSYKRIFYWAVNVATSGNLMVNAVVPNAGQNLTWGQKKQMTWGQLKLVPWGQAADLPHSSTIGVGKGLYARKHYRVSGSYRHMRTYFIVKTTALPNSVADSVVRIYNLDVAVKVGERAKERVS